MASLPPGWTADYDGQRWFFTYGPTGQSQFQFPRPGDEFPDFLLCCGPGGGAVLPPEVELSPEERLESERQVRTQLLDAAGSGSGGTTGEVVVDEDGGLLVPRLSPVREPGCDEEVGAVCFGNFAAVKSWNGRRLSGVREEGTRSVRQRERCDGDEVGIPMTTGVVDAFRESSGEPVSVLLVNKEEHAQAACPPHRELGSTAAISIMSEPVMAVAETKVIAPSMGLRGGSEPQIAPVAQLSPLELPTLDGRTVESADTPPWILSVGVIPELYSESTALCEEEINPPPVELPGDEGSGNGQAIIPNKSVQSPVELPAYEAPGSSLGNGDRAARLEQRCLASDYAANSKAGWEGAPGEKRLGHDRAGLPFQASRRSPEKSNDEASTSERLNSAPDQKLSSRDTDQPAEKARAEPRDLTNFPSVLRPGPRRSSGQQRSPPPPVVPASVTNTSHAAAHAQLRQQPRGRQHEEQAEACPVSQEQPARMPAEPPLLPSHPREPQRTSPTASTEAPQPPSGGARQQGRPPASVNFVIPIRHISKDELHYDASGGAAAAGGGSPDYQVGPSFASAISPERSAGQASGEGSLGYALGRKTGSWDWRAGETEPVQLVGRRFAPGMGQDWSWGWAR